MELNNGIAFKSSEELMKKFSVRGVNKTFAEGEVILNENAYIKAIPVVISGSVKVVRMDDEGRELLLYYDCYHNESEKTFLEGSSEITISLSPQNLRFAGFRES